PRIRRPVRHMARGASFQPHRSVLEREWPGFIAVTIDARHLVRSSRLYGAWQHRSVRVVAIDAAHRAFRQSMLVRLLEARPNIGMARRTLLINLDRFSCDQSVWPVLVNRMTRCATHLVFCMTAVESSDMSALVQMTGEAQTVGLGSFQFRGLPD